MKAQHFLLFAFAILYALPSCQNQSSGQEAQSDTATGALLSAGSAGQGTAIFTDSGQLPSGLNLEGEFLQGGRWESRGATYYGLVSKYQQGEFFSPGWVSRLNIYFFETRNGQVSSRKAFSVEAPNIYSEASLNLDRTQVVNLPSLGMAFSIVYSICPDGEDPCTIYSTVMGPAGKYDFQVMGNVDAAIYIESRADIMEGIPEDVQLHMVEQLFPGNE